jgi:hypothetical protein
MLRTLSGLIAVVAVSIMSFLVDVETIEMKNDWLFKACLRIPSRCPFERDVRIMGVKLFRIPPLCKLNPRKDRVDILRFKAVCFAVDELGYDYSDLQ